MEHPHVLHISPREALKVLNIKVTQEEKSKIINGNHDVVFKVISKLKDIHQRNSKESKHGIT